MGGAARKILDGTFCRSDNEAYKDAWNKLDQRYGQPFIIQHAFRQKLASWPKVQHKDAVGLRDFSYFLNAYQDAMPHVEGLQILNNCEENQKLVQKLLEWAASLWNRQVTQSLREKSSFPDFRAFAALSHWKQKLFATQSLPPMPVVWDLLKNKVLRKVKAIRLMFLILRLLFRVQGTQGTNKQRVLKKNAKSSCLFCHDSRHQLNDCHKVMTKTLEERRIYVKENSLCYGCLKQGHTV